MFQNLLEEVTITQIGTPIPTLSLEPPVFWRESMALQTGKRYIGWAEWLPQPATQTRCLILCVGGHLPAGWSPGGSCVFLAPGQTDLFRMFNLVQGIFG